MLKRDFKFFCFVLLVSCLSEVEIFLLLFINAWAMGDTTRGAVSTALSLIILDRDESDKVHFNKWFRIYTFCSTLTFFIVHIRRIVFNSAPVTEHAIIHLRVSRGRP